MGKKFEGLPCLEVGCRKVAENKGRCFDHQLPAFFGNFRKENLPKNWESLRRYVLARDYWVCWVCGETGADGVDHIIPGNNHSFENLKAIHHNIQNSKGEYCHRIKTAKEGNIAKEKRKPKEFGNFWLEKIKKGEI